MTIRIRDWHLYEPDRKSGGTEGPLDFAKWRVHGFYASLAYRRLADAAGAELLHALGLFGKLIEMAADQPRACRDGLIRSKREGNAATLDDIVYAAFPNSQAHAEARPIVLRLLGYLSAPGVEWVEIRDNGDVQASPEISGDFRKPPEVSGDSRELPDDAGKVPPNLERNETEPRQNSDEDKEGNEEGSDSFSSGTRLDSDSKTTPAHHGVRSTTFATLMHRFRVPVDELQKPGEAGKQARSDRRSLVTICEHVIRARDRPEARKEADELLALADACIAEKASHGRADKLKWFTFKAKQKYPGLFTKGESPCRN